MNLRTERPSRDIPSKSPARLAFRRECRSNPRSSSMIFKAECCARGPLHHATHVIFRIDDRQAGRELIRRLSEVDASAAHPTSPAGDTWVSTALSYQGLKALGVPRASLESFPPEFQ